MGEIMGGVRSMMTYIGAAQLKEAPKGATFVRVTAQTNDVYGGSRTRARAAARATSPVRRRSRFPVRPSSRRR
jgi:hypothetical protein